MSSSIKHEKVQKDSDAREKKGYKNKYDVALLSPAEPLRNSLFVDKIHNEDRISYKNHVPNDNGTVPRSISFNINYEYSNTRFTIVDELRLYFNNLKIKSNVKIFQNKFNKRFIQIELIDASESYFQEIFAAKNIIGEELRRYEDNFDKEYDGEPLYIETDRSDILRSRIIRLGSTSENSINRDIKTLDELRGVLNDYRYNRDETSHYRANLIVRFYVCTLPNNRLSIKPYIDTLELWYNKANCTSMINNDTKALVVDNVLVL